MSLLDGWTGIDADITKVLSEYLGFTWTFYPKLPHTDKMGRLLTELAINSGEAELKIGHMPIGELKSANLTGKMPCMIIFLEKPAIA